MLPQGKFAIFSEMPCPALSGTELKNLDEKNAPVYIRHDGVTPHTPPPSNVDPCRSVKMLLIKVRPLAPE